MRSASAPASSAARWTGYVAVAIVFAIACAFLANWQFTRNAGRAEQLALVAANYDSAPVSLSEVIPLGRSLDPQDEWQQVVVNGHYLLDQQILARNRPHSGSAAFEVLVPFELTDGRVLVVDRGWLPPGEQQNEPDIIPAAPSGEVEVVARLRPSESLPTSGRSAPPGQVPTIHVPSVAAIVDPDGSATIEQSAYGLMVSENPAPATRPTALSSPSDDPGPYLSYAIQWILFAVMGFAFIGYVIRSEKRHRREDAEDHAEVQRAQAEGREPVLTSSAGSRRRKRDRDSEDEDALIDHLQR